MIQVDNMYVRLRLFLLILMFGAYVLHITFTGKVQGLHLSYVDKTCIRKQTSAKNHYQTCVIMHLSPYEISRVPPLLLNIRCMCTVTFSFFWMYLSLELYTY